MYGQPPTHLSSPASLNTHSATLFLVTPMVSFPLPKNVATTSLPSSSLSFSPPTRNTVHLTLLTGSPCAARPTPCISSIMCFAKSCMVSRLNDQKVEEASAGAGKDGVERTRARVMLWAARRGRKVA